jgi:hypothetical protein
MAMFNSFVYVYQRVWGVRFHRQVAQTPKGVGPRQFQRRCHDANHRSLPAHATCVVGFVCATQRLLATWYLKHIVFYTWYRSFGGCAAMEIVQPHGRVIHESANRAVVPHGHLGASLLPSHSNLGRRWGFAARSRTQFFFGPDWHQPD